MGATEDVATFVVETRFEQIPREAVDAAKGAILDGLGVALAGVSEPSSKMISQYVRRAGGRPEAGVIGHGFKTSADRAALANGTLMHALDYDDVSTAMGGHPTAPVLPAVLALGQATGASGREALAAYILGVEVAIRIGQGLGARHYNRGWHATATLGTLGAAAAACKLLGLDVGGTRRALGIAASEAGGLRQNFGTMTKPFHAGNAARSGLVAALLAREGFTADENILEAPFGFCSVLGEGYDPAAMTRSLGHPFAIVSPGLEMKPYPCCRVAHRAIDAMLYLVSQHHFSQEEVVEVECATSPQSPRILIHSHPRSGLEGKFSMEYCMAIAIIDGEVGLAQFSDEKVLSPQAQELVWKVRYVYPAQDGGGSALPTFPETVTVRLRDGREISHRVEWARGDPQNPLSREELVSKYQVCARGALSPAHIERSLEMVWNLEKLGAATELAELVTTQARVESYG
jgi:2-methylcitrate dehydratase PrpD